MDKKPSSWISHIEAFVDSSRPPKQQAASVDAIAALVKNDLLTLEALVREMELYLATSDHSIRARGILLLAEILNCLISKPLDSATVSSLVEFFTSKLADWQVLRGALIGCLALLRRKKNVGMVKSSEARALAESYLMNVQVQSLAVHDRKLCFEVLQCLLEVYPEAVEMLGDDLVYGICEAIDEEKDPRCLMLTFHLVEILARVFPDSSGSVASFAGDLFDILSRYFPIYFTHPGSDDLDITREELSRALMNAFCSTPFFEPFAIPLLLEKLSSSLPLAKLDSLRYLNNCIQHYGTDRMIKHARAIWSNLKDVIFNHSPHQTLFSTSESAGNMESEENQIAKEAVICLQTAILHLDSLEKDPVLSFIVEDEDIEMKFGLVSNEGTGTGISIESRRQLSAVGNILSVSSKASMSGCTRVFQNFFPRLMNILEISASRSSYDCDTNNRTSSLNFGALYLCIQLLASCRELTLTSQDFSPQVTTVQDGWWCMLQYFSGPLAHSLGSALVAARSSELVNNNTGHEHAVYEVKGLQVLATFPGCYLPISEDVYRYILVILMSIVTERFEDTFLWKLSVKVLIEIGSCIEKYHDSYRGISFNRIVVERIVSLFQHDDSTMPLALKLDAISEIGTIGVDYMSRVIKLLEEAILSKFLAVCVEGHLEAAEILVPLLECYSNRVLLWCYTSGKFDEVAMRFALCIWNQMESITIFNQDVKIQDLLDRIMMTMKLLVGGCAEENQLLIVQKAYSVLLSANFLSEESLSFSSSKLEGLLQLTPDLVKLSWRDEWIVSLFASVVMALLPQTPLPDVKLLVNMLTTFQLKGHLPAAQALASIVNKWHVNIDKSEVPSAYTLDEAIEMILERTLLSVEGSSNPGKSDLLNNGERMLSCLCLLNNNSSFQSNAVFGLAWIGKGLLMRGHEKVKEIAVLLLKYLLSNPYKELHSDVSGSGDGLDVHGSLAISAADAFHVIMSDSEACLNKKFHAMIRPLYKQRFFSSMMPVLLSSIKESGSSSMRVALYRAFAHVISDAPLAAVVAEAKKIIPSLMDSLAMLSEDVLNKDLIYSLLLVLSGILIDDNGKEAIIENINTVISHLIRLIFYPHMMLVRETAIQCLVAMSGFPHARIYPMRPQVLRAVSKALDDQKRVVRREAVRCRQSWVSMA